jgi:NTP pyrophosphatase (non-canonical NTP hydrolase)
MNTNTEKQQQMEFWDNSVNKSLAQVGNERMKQVMKWGMQDHSIEKWVVILTEEVGELAKAVLEQDLDGVKKEAVQVAAVAAAIVQKLDTNKPV